MVYMLFSRWHFPSLGRTMPPSLPSPAKWKPASVENTSSRVTFLQPICSCKERSFSVISYTNTQHSCQIKWRNKHSTLHRERPLSVILPRRLPPAWWHQNPPQESPSFPRSAAGWPNGWTRLPCLSASRRSYSWRGWCSSGSLCRGWWAWLAWCWCKAWPSSPQMSRNLKGDPVYITSTTGEMFYSLSVGSLVRLTNTKWISMKVCGRIGTEQRNLSCIGVDVD